MFNHAWGYFYAGYFYLTGIPGQVESPRGPQADH